MRNDGREAPLLVLGPLLRYAGETQATVWVETDRACEVEVLGHRAATFEVSGHHYGLVVVSGLEPGTTYAYEVALDGTVRWPVPGSGWPASVIRTLEPGRPLRLAFGSCRIAELMPPRGRQRARHDAEHGLDVLRACALDLRGQPPERWPDLLLMIGDQVYADETGPATCHFISERRDPAQPPGYQVADFTEYCFLYREAWSEPAVRWLLSAVPTAMIFDDHDVHDDWNTSAAWWLEQQAKPWWPGRISGAYLSYWLYQHLGNLPPAELADDELLGKVRAAGDGTAVLTDFAERAGRGAAEAQWSYRLTLGRVRVVVIDSRAGRVLADGKRLMVSDREWQWVTESVSGDWDHLVIATSLPLLLPRGVHELEAWNEAVCAGAWGKRLARTGERVRRAADLEHWAAFGESFTRFERLLTEVATGAHGRPPATVTVISGDIHHSYLAAVELPAGTPAGSAVYQAVCSPMHNALPRRLRRAQQLATSPAGQLAGRALARLAGVGKPQLRWRITHGPWFSNMLAQLEYDGPRARLRMWGSTPDPAGSDGDAHLRPVCDAGLS
jgi:PhoD-like phosphatase